MLKEIHIDGLKSLKDFHLELKPGLNVLVGPNGSGKSNVLIAFELISNLNNLKLLNSLGQLGTIELGKLFDVHERDKKIKITVAGEVEENISTFNRNKIDLHYAFHCELKYKPEFKNKLFFAQQKLELQVFQNDCEISPKLIVEYNGKRIKVNHLDFFPLEFEKMPGNDFIEYVVNSLSKNTSKNLSDVNSRMEIEKMSEDSEHVGNFIKYIFESRLRERDAALEQHTLINELKHIFKPLQSVLTELESGKTYNLDPNQIRKKINGMGSPVVAHDGTGLLPALLDISDGLNGNTKRTNGSINSIDYYRGMYETIIAYLQDVLPEATDLNVSYDQTREEVTGNVVLKHKNGKKKKLAIELLSEGSLKWLSLVTILLTSKNVFTMEEPENFLHPAMQHHIIELMRESIDSKDEIRLFTTHSETILNMIEPEEVILTYYRDGRTLVKRIDNPEALKKAIEKTGFGIGWQLVSGKFDYGNVMET